jgi:hypothetical protein
VKAPIIKIMKSLNQHKFWRNEFLDIIHFDGVDITYRRWCISMDGGYVTSRGGLNQAKNFVNEKRGLKTKWTKINSY